MTTNHLIEKKQAVDEARQQVQGLGIPCDDFGRAAERVLQADPPVIGVTLKDLIVQEVIEEWMMRGKGYC